MTDETEKTTAQITSQFTEGRHVTEHAPSGEPIIIDGDYSSPHLDDRLRGMISGQSKPVMAVDADTRIVFANEQWLDATQTDWEAVGERHYFEAFPIARDRVARIALKVRRALNGNTSEFAVGEDGHPVVRGRGNEARWTALQQPVVGASGEVSHVVQILEPVQETDAPE